VGELKRRNAWRERRVGSLRLTLLRAREVYDAAAALAERGMFVRERPVRSDEAPRVVAGTHQACSDAGSRPAAPPRSLVAPPMHMTAGELGLDPTAVRQRGASMSSGVDRLTDVSLEVFSTCVQSSEGDPETYVQRVADVARW